MTLDTNILIAYLNGEGEVVETLSNWRESGRVLFVSSLSVAEVLALPNLTPHEAEKAKIFLRGFISVPVDDDLAEMAAMIKRMYNLGLPDAIIAATALSNKVPIVTRDKQFLKIQEIIVIAI
jgi:predicted nucleic acid-binding protein